MHCNLKYSRPLSYDIRSLINEKHKCWKRYVKSKLQEDLVKHKTIRNMVK